MSSCASTARENYSRPLRHRRREVLAGFSAPKPLRAVGEGEASQTVGAAKAS